jgi:preprotein translocase subunit SecD
MSPDAPGARFFVLRGAPALTNADLVNPQAITSNPGERIVTFGFTAAGRRAFQAMTATLAGRGARLSGRGETFDQHFAIAVDNKLVTVQLIDFKPYPNGLDGSYAADIACDLTTQSATDLAILLRYGPLAVKLTATG